MLDSCYLKFNQSNTTQPLIIKQRPYTTWYIVIEISITNNSDCKFTLCMSPAWLHEGILCMRLRGFYICQRFIIWDSPSETYKKSWVERESPPKWIPAVPEHWERKTNRSASLTAATWFSLCGDFHCLWHSRKTQAISYTPWGYTLKLQFYSGFQTEE